MYSAFIEICPAIDCGFDHHESGPPEYIENLRSWISA